MTEVDCRIYMMMAAACSGSLIGQSLGDISNGQKVNHLTLVIGGVSCIVLHIMMYT